MQPHQLMQQQQQPINVFPNPVAGGGPAPGHIAQQIIGQPVPTPPIHFQPPPVVPVYPEGELVQQVQQVC